VRILQYLSDSIILAGFWATLYFLSGGYSAIRTQRASRI